MFFGLMIAVCLGVIIGIFTGLVPGIHVNLVTVLLVSFSPVLLTYTSGLALCSFIIALAITHSFLDAIPSIYLGAPDADMVLNVLPGHRLLRQGKGHLAVKMTIVGSLAALVLSIALMPFFLSSMGYLQPLIGGWISFILIGVVLFMAIRERKPAFAFLMVICAGTLGWLVLSAPGLTQPLFPLLSGLFGVSLLLMSEEGGIPKQLEEAKMEAKKSAVIKAGVASTSVGFLAAFLPGFGSSQAAIIAQQAVGDLGDEGFLALVGGINTANMAISIGAAYVLEKARNGAIVGVLDLIGTVSKEAFFIFLAVSLIAGGAAGILAVSISKVFASLIVRVPYKAVIWSIIIFIIFLTIIFDGSMGLIVLITSTALGIFASLLGVGKNHLMACLMVPVIIYLI